jgi:hypothetical protein
MKDIITKINEAHKVEQWTVKCKKELQTKHLTFKAGEEYEAINLNENWWLIDSVGVSKADFGKYFDKIEEINIKAQ